MKLVAEYVSPGHPDRLCDQIVESIVTFVTTKDREALCSLECAVSNKKVFIDGVIVAGKDALVITNSEIKDVVKKVYYDAGYNDSNETSYKWEPYLEDLEIILDVNIETLVDGERRIRKYSDDQNIVTGYAINSKETDYLPIAHFLANFIGRKIVEYRDATIFGPDFKVLVQLNYSGSVYTWDRLTVSIHHNRRKSFREMYAMMKSVIDKILEELNTLGFNSLSKISNLNFYLNGAGDFVKGGPIGDSGLSGKKLCLDFYGPDIPIGGGAISGKDSFKVDVCGAFRARELALELVKQHNYYSVFVTLAWSPGEAEPYLIQAFEIKKNGLRLRIDDSLLPPKDWFSIECINYDLKLPEMKRREKVVQGYMFSK
ncbi:MAG TPA: methionine adenosyltransferase domain-containing protein [Bacilli bacterium]|nr:methionine adenosyltransferase domain-containing protein [Bacilli bacterium]